MKYHNRSFPPKQSRQPARPARPLGRALTPALLMAAAWSMPAHAISTNADVAYVETALKNAPVLTTGYGTVSAASVSLTPTLPLNQITSGTSLTTSSATGLINFPGTGSAQAAGDISTGVLRAYAQELGITGASAAAGAGFWDTLTFSGVTGTSPTGTMVFNVGGTFTDVGFGAACEGYQIGLTGSSTCGSGTGSDPFAPGVTVLNSGNPSETLSLSFPLSNGTPTKLAWTLGAAANNTFNGATADLFDPPQVSLSLPGGVTYHSASNMFLTNVAPVPLPAAAWLFGSGLLGLIGIARRKKTV